MKFQRGNNTINHSFAFLFFKIAGCRFLFCLLRSVQTLGVDIRRVELHAGKYMRLLTRN